MNTVLFFYCHFENLCLKEVKLCFRDDVVAFKLVKIVLTVFSDGRATRKSVNTLDELAAVWR